MDNKNPQNDNIRIGWAPGIDQSAIIILIHAQKPNKPEARFSIMITIKQ